MYCTFVRIHKIMYCDFVRGHKHQATKLLFDSSQLEAAEILVAAHKLEAAIKVVRTEKNQKLPYHDTGSISD